MTNQHSLYGVSEHESSVSGSYVLYVDDYDDKVENGETVKGNKEIHSRQAGMSTPLNDINEVSKRYLCIAPDKTIRIALDGYRPRGERYWVEEKHNGMYTLKYQYGENSYNWCSDEDLSYELQEDTIEKSAWSGMGEIFKNENGVWCMRTSGKRYERTEETDVFGNHYYEENSYNSPWYCNIDGGGLGYNFLDNQTIRTKTIETES